MIKVLERLRIQGTCLNITKTIYSKPTANIKLNGEKLKAITQKSGTRQGCPLLPCLFNIVLEVLPRANKTAKEDQGNTNWKGRIQIIIIYRLSYIVYKSNSKNPTRKLLQLMNTFSEVAGYKPSYIQIMNCLRKIRESYSQMPQIV